MSFNAWPETGVRDALVQEQPANMTNTDARVEPPTPVDASVLPDDASHHRSVSEVGANGQVPELPHGSGNYNIHTPNSTLPRGENSLQPNLLPGQGIPLGGPPAPTSPGIPSEALPLPSGNRSEHGSRAAGRSELRIRELETRAKQHAMASNLRMNG